MTTHADLEKCQTFLDAQLRPGASLRPRNETTTLRAITLSRQAGCGALVVAEKLAQRLTARDKTGAAPWTVFDRNLIEQVLQDHNLPVRLAKYLPEDRVFEVQDAMDEIFGVHPSTWTIVEQTAETILRLTHLGNVILVGRGANMIAAKMSGVFHVRLVAPLADRIAHAHQYYNMTPGEAREFIEREDKGRARYLKKYFDADVENPLLYHLVINTSLVSYDTAADLIVAAANAARIAPTAINHA
jgi:cytidylate kinase